MVQAASWRRQWSIRQCTLVESFIHERKGQERGRIKGETRISLPAENNTLNPFRSPFLSPQSLPQPYNIHTLCRPTLLTCCACAA